VKKFLKVPRLWNMIFFAIIYVYVCNVPRYGWICNLALSNQVEETHM
jgi:hypothetical protein